jgi:neutral ceramidase
MRLRSSQLKRVIATVFAFILLTSASAPGYSEEAGQETGSDAFPFEAGMSRVDITGPAVGIMFWGYAQEGQKGEGIHLRQYARSLVIKDTQSGRLLAYVTGELGGIPHEIHRDVVARLRKEVDPGFNMANVLLNGSHTHSGPAGFFHYIENSIYTTKFFPEYYNVIVDGIVRSIRDAYLKKAPAQLLIGSTAVEGAGVNRSLVAYNANPEEERKRYTTNIDTTMVQISVKTSKGTIGVINWFGVHPTSMTFDNHLISSDNKGYASYLAEREALKRGQKDFVAIFAQANEGDVTPNLNLNNTGPGKDMFESTKIIGERQYEASRRLLFSDDLRPLPAGLRFTQSFIDMPNSVVKKEFSGTGKEERTCLSAYGYALAAGSTEEGGGHWLFHEGMKDENRRFYIDWLAAHMLQSPTEELRECQRPKAVLFAMGETKPHPSLSQILPIGLVSVGDFVLIVSPNEVTTMSSRRMKDTVRKVLGDRARDIALSGLTNDFAGYVTTREEYSTQQYEGGHTLHGPFSLALFQQEYDRLAKDLRDDRPSNPGRAPRDLSASVQKTEIPGRRLVESFEAGVMTPNPTSVQIGETVRCDVRALHPNIAYPKQRSYFDVERKEGNAWKVVYNDADWATKFYFKQALLPVLPDRIELVWETTGEDKPGIYRLKHSSFYKSADGKEVPYSVACPEFELK